jgi:hypothetical protein
MNRGIAGRLGTFASTFAMVVVVPLLVAAITGSPVGASNQPVLAISQASLTRLINVSLTVKKLPNSTVPAISTLLNNGDFGSPLDTTSCGYIKTNAWQENIAHCYYGDTKSKTTVALVGDSRASMYLQTFDQLGKLEHFKVLFIAKDGCPSPLGTYMTNNGGPVTPTPWTACSNFHTYAIANLKRIKPRVIVISSNSELVLANPDRLAAGPEVQSDMTAFLSKLPASSRVIVLGGFPQPAPVANPTVCLSRHPSDVAACAFSPSKSTQTFNAAFSSAAKAEGDIFINQTPWYCTRMCPAVIGNYIPFTIDAYHADNTYLQFLIGVLWASIEHYVN